jgi:hypothetical protein
MESFIVTMSRATAEAPAMVGMFCISTRPHLALAEAGKAGHV